MIPKNSIIIALAVACLALCSSAHAQTGGEARYFYDANGRLTAVLSPTGEGVTYAYDPAGNFTSITRRAATELSILEFTPGAGAAGTQVTIFGTGFLPTPAANTVKFNGVTATVAAATKIQLTVTVPAGAGTGPINITNANGTVTSSANFYIPTSGVEFPIPIAFGESVPFLFATPPTGQNLTKVALMFFAGSAGQRASIVVEDLLCGQNSNPPPYAYAQISVVSPSSAVIASVPFQNITLPGQPAPVPFAYVESLVLPLTGQYTIVIDPIDTFPTKLCGGFIRSFGATARLYDVPPDVTGSLTIGAQPITVNIPSVGQAALLTFTVASTQAVTVHITGNFVGNDNATAVSLLRSDNTVVTTTTSTSIAFDLAQQSLTAGTYRVKIDPQGTNAGSVSVNLTSP